MKVTSLLSKALLVCASASLLTASPVNFAGMASFVGGTSGQWSFKYVSGAPNLYIQSIRIDLGPTGLKFDSASGGFGSLSWQDITGFGSADATTGLTSYTSGSALDGNTVEIFTFNNFGVGMTFNFLGDVDHPDPSLQTILNCAGKTGVALITCNATNAVRTGLNTAALVGAEFVTPNDMANAIVTFQLGGPDYGTSSVSGAFKTVTLRDIINGLLHNEGPDAFATNAAIETPEPATMLNLGVGLGALLLPATRLRKRAAR